MSQEAKARLFGALHRKGDPVVLYNIWDAGSARAVADAGAKAVATGSLSVAGALGYPDGEALPLDVLEMMAGRISASVELPLSVDFEGGYASDAAGITANVGRIIAAGAIGVNFEDQVVGGAGLYPAKAQAARIAAARAAGEAAKLPFFINARTDLFLKEKDLEKHAALLDEAIERARIYTESGASGIFMPGLKTPELIRKAADAVALPLNILVMPGVPEAKQLAALGVARISHGPWPWRDAMAALKAKAEAVFAG